MAESGRMSSQEKASWIAEMRRHLIHMLEDYPYEGYDGKHWRASYWTRSYLTQAIEAMFRLESDIIAEIADSIQERLGAEKDAFENAETEAKQEWEDKHPSE